MGIDKIKKTILVIGANGQLGSEIKVLSANYVQFAWLFVTRSDFSLENESQMIDYLNEHKPDFIINCAAYTAVDKAETEKDLANTINNVAVGTIAKWCFDYDAKLIHVSTDYVFDGNSPIPLTEKDQTNPINHYGLTKLRGEENCFQQNPESIIIRTSWVYSEFGNNFVKTMIRFMKERESLNIVNDQIGSPTYASDLAAAILVIICNEKWHSGLYNYSNEGEISWLQFAEEIKKITKSDCKLIGVPSSAYPTPARRPNYSLLDKSKIKNVFKLDVVDYQSSLAICVNKLQH